MRSVSRSIAFATAVCGVGLLIGPVTGRASGGSGGGGGGGSTGSTIKVSKCYYAVSNQTMLVNASSSNTAAHLYMYLPSGSYVGEVQNGGGGKYGGTVFFVAADPVAVTIVSSAGDSTTVPTTPFVL